MKQLPPWVSSLGSGPNAPTVPDLEPAAESRLLIPPATARLFQAISRFGPQEREGLWLPARVLNYGREIGRRRRFLREYSWSVPTPAAVAAIAAFVGDRRLLEVGAGSGLWSRLLSEFGARVTATDDGSWSDAADRAGKPLPSGFSVDTGRFFPVQRLSGGDAVRRFADHEALLLCWPPYERGLATDALTAFHGDALVYIGDWKCTGDESFRAQLAAGWRLVQSLSLPTWPGVADAAYLYRRQSWSGIETRGPNPHLTQLT